MTSISATAEVLALRLKMSLARLAKRSVDQERLLNDPDYKRELLTECRSLRHPDLDALVTQLESLFDESIDEGGAPASEPAAAPAGSLRMKPDVRTTRAAPSLAASSNPSGSPQPDLPTEGGAIRAGSRYLRGAR